MSSEKEKRILKDIEKSGYPLEVDVIEQFMKKYWSVFPQYPYFDKQKERMRAIDMVAYYPAEMRAFFLPMLIVECKKSEKPWIFYSVPVYHLRNLEKHQQLMYGNVGLNIQFISTKFIGIFSLLPPGIDFEKHQTLISEMFKEIQELHFFNPDLSTAYSCHVAFKKKREDSPDDFQEALYQIKGAYLQLGKDVGKIPIFTTIVLRGDLYEYKKKSSGPKLENRNHILFTTFLLASGLPEEAKSSKYPFPPVFIDVVKDTYFADYLRLLEKDLAIMRKITEKLRKA